jgi:hypothetical protein
MSEEGRGYLLWVKIWTERSGKSYIGAGTWTILLRRRI